MADESSNLRRLQSSVQTLLSDTAGQNLVEYGLVVGLVGLAVVVSTTSMATSLKNAFSTMGSALAAHV